MNTYIILRRSGWNSPEELQKAAARSEATGEDMTDTIRWIRSYVMDENDGALGTVCVYQATEPEAIRRHAEIAVLPVDEIIPVMDTVVKRPDPQ
jgi:thiamine biosynthesis protein ThiC